MKCLLTPLTGRNGCATGKSQWLWVWRYSYFIQCSQQKTQPDWHYGLVSVDRKYEGMNITKMPQGKGTHARVGIACVMRNRYNTENHLHCCKSLQVFRSREFHTCFQSPFYAYRPYLPHLSRQLATLGCVFLFLTVQELPERSFNEALGHMHFACALRAA